MTSGLEIRSERASDRDAVRRLNRAAFGGDTEATLVDGLRTTEAFIPELSLVAIRDGTVAGHILMTRGAVVSDDSETPVLALAPMAVLPEHQREGIGSQLVLRALADARSLGHELIIVLGHPEYYPRFGFVPASRFGIVAPFEVPDEAFMALWLRESGSRIVNGMMRYARPFMEAM